MTMSRSLRSNVALGLLFNILVLTFACGLIGVSDGSAHPESVWVPLCSQEGGSLVELSGYPVGASHDHAQTMSFDCPVCQSAALLLLLVLVLLLRHLRCAQRIPLPSSAWFPRQAWPPANPRAP